jgi:hypothetical protein
LVNVYLQGSIGFLFGIIWAYASIPVFVPEPPMAITVYVNYFTIGRDSTVGHGRRLVAMYDAKVIVRHNI